jgi:hypothetical protein
LDRAVACIGRRVLIDVGSVFEWIEQEQGHRLNDATMRGGRDEYGAK